MKRTTIATVRKTELTNVDTVFVLLDNGLYFEQSCPETTPKPGELVRIEMVWGEDYRAPVVPIREADPVLEVLLDEEEAIAGSGVSWRR